MVIICLWQKQRIDKLVFLTCYAKPDVKIIFEKYSHNLHIN